MGGKLSSTSDISQQNKYARDGDVSKMEKTAPYAILRPRQHYACKGALDRRPVQF
jgi:hypothetical protein